MFAPYPDTDHELRGSLSQLVETEQCATARIVFRLGELEARSGYLQAGYSSLFAYCTIALGYSEPAAIRRIKAARCVRRFPMVGKLLKQRKLTLTTVCTLAEVLDRRNERKLLAEAAGKSKREVERLAARYKPLVNYDLRDQVRRVFIETPGKSAEEIEKERHMSSWELELKRKFTDHLRQRTGNMSVTEKVRFSFVSEPEFAGKVKRMRQLLSGKYMRGASLEQVFTEAIECYIRHNDPVEKARRKLARASREGSKGRSKSARKSGAFKRSRHIPADTYLQVYFRDKGRCTYVASDGRRCDACSGLQIDHIVPFAKGGSNHPENLRLLCREHNRLAAEKEFGKEHMRRFRKAG